MIRVLCVGDVVGAPGRAFLREYLCQIKRKLAVDVTVVNGENAADRNGLTPQAAEQLFESGADLITTGNHVFRCKEICEYLEQQPMVLRPQNLGSRLPGSGVGVIDKGAFQLAVVNLIGTVYMENAELPLLALDEILPKISQKMILVDFHAEATSEKRAFGFYADGRISAVVGTHTHVQTADAQLLPESTAYITDLGMTGTIHSVLGVKSEIIIQKLTTRMPQRFDNASGPCSLSGALIELDEKTGRALAIRAVRFEETLVDNRRTICEIS